MINVKFKTKEFTKVLDNSVKYSDGFIQGVKLAKIQFNTELGIFIQQALYKYIDAKARANPESLHHVYEWGRAGSSNARLFQINVIPTQTMIRFSGNFLPSSSTSPTSNTPFENKAEIMENGIEITIEPKNAEFLVFDVNNTTIFTKKQITVTNPGGPQVAGSFERAVNEFFNNYLTTGLLQASGIFKKLENPIEFLRFFSEGAKGGGTKSGIKAGKKYLTTGGVDIQ